MFLQKTEDTFWTDTPSSHSAYDQVSPCQCGGQRSIAMCQPASDRIKHGWPATWLTDRKQAAMRHQALPHVFWCKLCIIHTRIFHCIATLETPKQPQNDLRVKLFWSCSKLYIYWNTTFIYLLFFFFSEASGKQWEHDTLIAIHGATHSSSLETMWEKVGVLFGILLFITFNL